MSLGINRVETLNFTFEVKGDTVELTGNRGETLVLKLVSHTDYPDDVRSHLLKEVAADIDLELQQQE